MATPVISQLFVLLLTLALFAKGCQGFFFFNDSLPVGITNGPLDGNITKTCRKHVQDYFDRLNDPKTYSDLSSWPVQSTRYILSRENSKYFFLTIH